MVHVSLYAIMVINLRGKATEIGGQQLAIRSLRSEVTLFSHPKYLYESVSDYISTNSEGHDFPPAFCLEDACVP